MAKRHRRLGSWFGSVLALAETSGRAGDGGGRYLVVSGQFPIVCQHVLSLVFPQDLSKSPKTMKKLLPKRKPERKPSDEEFAVRKSECPPVGARPPRGSQGHAVGEMTFPW